MHELYKLCNKNIYLIFPFWAGIFCFLTQHHHLSPSSLNYLSRLLNDRLTVFKLVTFALFSKWKQEWSFSETNIFLLLSYLILITHSIPKFIKNSNTPSGKSVLLHLNLISWPSASFINSSLLGFFSLWAFIPAGTWCMLFE